MTDELCPNCKQPKPGGVSGSLTQWIFVCHCASLKAAEEEADSHRFQICRKCRKRVNTGRDGSLTQFVFRSDSCRCEAPEVLDVAITRPIAAPSFDEVDATFGADIPALELSADSFPSERFKPIRELGRGASGAVHLCVDKLLGNYVAVKTLHHLSTEQLLSFQQEARAISRLNHPNIVRILDFGATSGGIPYMVLEYVNGVNLESYVTRHGLLSLDDIVRLMISACDALAYSHSKDIFHRDLKPTNMLVIENPDGLSVKLVDFGVARVKFESAEPTILEGTSVVGTPAYMSPDQMRGVSFDQCSEVYSLGCILFELLTGRQIYSADTVLEIVGMHANAPIPRLNDFVEAPGYPEKLEQIFRRCVAKAREARYQSMSDLKADLEELSASDVQDAGSPAFENSSSPSGRDYSEAVQKAIRSNAQGAIASHSDAAVQKSSWPALLGCFMLIVVLSGGVYYLIWGASPQQIEKKEEKHSADKPGVFNNTLLETRFQVNSFNGDFWVFNMSPVNDKYLDDLELMKDYRRLWFDSGYISPSGILKLKPLKVVAFALINLELSSAHFENLKKLKELKALRLFENPGLADKHLGIVAQMDNLEELFIRSSGITDEGIALLSGMKNLKYLSLDRTAKLTDRTIDTLERMPTLRRLSLTKTGVSTKGIHRIARLKNLDTICLSYLPVDSSCIKELAAINPTRLALQGIPLTKSDLAVLSQISNLKLLDIRQCGVNRVLEEFFHDRRKKKNFPACRVVREKRPGIAGFGAMVYDTLDDEHMWTDSVMSVY